MDNVNVKVGKSSMVGVVGNFGLGSRNYRGGKY